MGAASGLILWCCNVAASRLSAVGGRTAGALYHEWIQYHDAAMLRFRIYLPVIYGRTAGALYHEWIQYHGAAMLWFRIYLPVIYGRHR